MNSVSHERPQEAFHEDRHRPPGRHPWVSEGIPSTPEAVKQSFTAFMDAGVDELIMMPTIPELEQVDRLAQLTA